MPMLTPRPTGDQHPRKIKVLVPLKSPRETSYLSLGGFNGLQQTSLDQLYHQLIQIVPQNFCVHLEFRGESARNTGNLTLLDEALPHSRPDIIEPKIALISHTEKHYLIANLLIND